MNNLSLWWRICVLALAVAFSLGATGSASAQSVASQSSRARRAKAKRLANKGFELLKAGDFKRAAEYFDRAERLQHSPMFVLFRAEATEKMGDLLGARKLLQSIIDEKLDRTATPAFRQAKKKAVERKAALDLRIPRVTVEAPPSSKVLLDGQPITSGVAVMANPGRHTVVVTAKSVVAGEAPQKRTQSFQLAAGQRRHLLFDKANAVTNGADATAAATSSGGISWVPAGVAFGVGGVGVVVAAITGVMYLNGLAKIDETCAPGIGPDELTCPAGFQPEVDASRRHGHIATAAWIVGGVGIAAGVVLSVFASRKSTASTSARTSLRLVPIQPQMNAAPTGAALLWSGNF